MLTRSEWALMVVLTLMASGTVCAALFSLCALTGGDCRIVWTVADEVARAMP